MSHIHTKPGEHDHTVSAYIFRLDGDEPRILFHLHKKLRRYVQFGGHIETNETPWQAIKHELMEESGYEMAQLKILQPKQRIRALTGAKLHPMPIYHNTHKINETHFHTDIAYAFVTAEEPKQKIAANESADIKLLSREELVKLPAEQTYESVRDPALFVFDVCLAEWERVDPASFD